MASRHPSRFDETSRRSGEPRESRTTREPREPRESTRESRTSRTAAESREVISPRERAEERDIISPRETARDTRDSRESREPRAIHSQIDQRMDARMDLRTEPSADPRMFGRGPEPRPDLRPDPRSDLRGDIRNEPREMRDLRDARDLRGEPLIDPRDPRFASSRDARDLREIRGSRDLYERDEMMDIDPPLSSGRLTTYFLPGDGISREVIQADICRYLGADATCMPYRNREGVPGYLIRAYRMLTTYMIEDLMADSKRWDEELRRSSRNRGAKPAYEDTEIHERRQMTGPTQISPGYIAPQTRERDDYPMEEDYRRQGPPPQRPLFSTTMATDYPPNYPMTCGPFQTPATTATADYMISPTRGQSAAYSQVPRSAEYDMYGAPTAGRGTTLQSPNQGQFASQQGFQAPVPYQDPRTGQMIYPSATAGRGFDQPSRHTNPADGRRR